jgi:hypothetical protein
MVTIDQVKADRAALVAEIEAAGGTVRPNGATLCPFHTNTKTPAGSVHRSPETGHWHYKCHSCGFSGSVVDVRQKHRGETLAETLSALAPRDREPPDTRGSAQNGKDEQGKAIYTASESGGQPAKSAGEAKKVYLTPEKAIEWFPQKGLRIEALHKYTNPDDRTRADFAVARLIDAEGKKTFKQLHPVEGGWVFGKPDGPLPLYNRARIRDAKSVLVVEGEKCVHAVTPYLPAGWAATTSPMGAGPGKAALADWSPLVGKAVVLWPDNDPPNQKGTREGIEHMNDVADILGKLTPAISLSWIDPAGLDLPPKGDVADWIEIRADCTKETIRDSLAVELSEARPLSGSSALFGFLQGCISGELLPLPFKGWPHLTLLSQATIPKSICLLCGDPGAGKSYWLLEAMMHWHFGGTKVALYELEEDDDVWQHRAFTLYNGNSKLASREWIHKHPREAMELYQVSREAMDSFARCLYTKSKKTDTNPNQLELVAWAEARAKEGCRVIGIDPATSAAVVGNQWVGDQDFVLRLLTIAKRYTCTIILVTHPKQNDKGKAGLHTLAGGAAYSRFSQSGIWLIKNAKESARMVKRDGMTQSLMCNREALIVKARHGSGGGRFIGFHFDPETFAFVEQGILEES